MVHTFDIGMMFCSHDNVVDLMKLFMFSKKTIKEFNIKGYADNNYGSKRKGIKKFSLYRCIERNKGKKGYCERVVGYSFKIQMEPWLFITRKESIDLFECTDENISMLVELFREFMIQYVNNTPYEYLAELQNWNCRRIDYTHNFQFKDERDANIFYRLSKKTSLYRRTKVKKIRDEKIFAQSTAEGNLSNKAMFYNKRNQIEDDYAGMNDDDFEAIMEEAKNVIRFEIQCYKGKVSTIKKKYGLPSRSIIGFLNEDIAKELLIKQYMSSIGDGDFFTLYKAKSRIMHYEGLMRNGRRITKNKREKLIQFMQLVADVRSLYKARSCFREGRRIKNSKVFVKGSDNTFLNRIKDLAYMGINPVAIPRSGKRTNAAGEIVVYDYPQYMVNPISSW